MAPDASRRPQMSPRRPQPVPDGSRQTKTGVDCSRGAPGCSKRVPDGPQLVPNGTRWLQTGPRWLQNVAHLPIHCSTSEFVAPPLNSLFYHSSQPFQSTRSGSIAQNTELVCSHSVSRLSHGPILGYSSQPIRLKQTSKRADRSLIILQVGLM